MFSKLHLALAFLTRLPLPPPAPPFALAGAMGMFPLVGLVVGCAGAGVYALAASVLAPGPSVWLALAATVLVTGGLHEDGLADVADGFGGGTDKTAKLAIMKDSRIGSFGVLALALGLLLRGTALAQLARPELVAGALIAAHVLSRAVLPLVLRGLAPARDGGLGAGAGRPEPAVCLLALALGLALCLVVLPKITAVAALLAALLAAGGMALLAQRQIGGHTGDVLGAVQQLAETAVLLTLAALP